jgi:hypothetical protein
VRILSPNFFLPENTDGFTARWMKNRISNLEYLLAINKSSGRSVLDCSRYSLMPWCIQSYESETINLTDSSYFRDLSKPLGIMIKNDRASNYEEQYMSMCKDGDPFPFNFGTYISNCTTPLYYLMRLQPITFAWKKFFGRVHESPERIFYSMIKHFKSITESSQDLKESIPEFYYLPEAFLNLNKFEISEKPSENWRVEMLELPIWAKQNPYYFVYLNRILLESSIVSERLPAWIDLIFGSNQQGQKAIQSNNVYQPLVYPDSAQRLLKSSEMNGDFQSIYSQIYHFGQVPQMLFDKPHPQKYPAVRPTSTPSFGAVPLELTTTGTHLSENHPLSAILAGLSVNQSTLSLLSSHNSLQYKIMRPSLECKFEKMTSVSRLASKP